MGSYNTGKSTTSKTKQATAIQLNSKGMTAAEGLIANGLSQGSVRQAINNALRKYVAEMACERGMVTDFPTSQQA
jgi:hypothetical protein